MHGRATSGNRSAGYRCCYMIALGATTLYQDIQDEEIDTVFAAAKLNALVQAKSIVLTQWLMVMMSWRMMDDDGDAAKHYRRRVTAR